MSNNPIAQLFEGQGDGAKLSTFDWRGHGVARKYCILFTGRTGSTLLTKLLRQTDRCGNPDELFNESYIPHQLAGLEDKSFASYFAHAVRANTINGYFGVEIDSLRFFWLSQLIDFDSDLFGKDSTQHIWLTREDLLSQAYSYAYAKATGVWHVLGDGQAVGGEAPDLGKTVSDEMIWKNLLLILTFEQKMERFIKEKALVPLRLTYEQLITDRAFVMGKILLHIGFDRKLVGELIATGAEPTAKIKYGDKTVRLLAFFERYRDLLSQIDERRQDIKIGYIENVLKKEFFLEV